MAARPQVRTARPQVRTRATRALNSIDPRLHVRARPIVHVLGRDPGRALCGANLPDCPANPLHGKELTREQWARAGYHVVEPLADAMRALVAKLPAGAEACRGCEINVSRMAAAAVRDRSTGQKG